MPAKYARLKGWTVSRENLAWAAGFVDGEGSFYLTHQDGRPARPRFEIGQVDPRALHRLRRILGFGAKVAGPYTNKKYARSRARPMWVYSVSGFEDVQALVALIWTWLGPVKRTQAMSIIKGA